MNLKREGIKLCLDSKVFFWNSGINAHGGKSYKCVALVVIFHFRAKGLGLYFAVLADAVSY